MLQRHAAVRSRGFGEETHHKSKASVRVIDWSFDALACVPTEREGTQRALAHPLKM